MSRPGRIVLLVVAAIGIMGILAVRFAETGGTYYEPSRFLFFSALGVALALLLAAIYVVDRAAQGVIRRRHPVGMD